MPRLRIDRIALIVAVLALLAGLMPGEVLAQDETLTIDRNSGPPETLVNLQGNGWTPGRGIVVWWDDEVYTPATILWVDDNGNWSSQLRVPEDAAPGQHEITAAYGADLNGVKDTPVTRTFTVTSPNPRGFVGILIERFTCAIQFPHAGGGCVIEELSGANLVTACFAGNQHACLELERRLGWQPVIR